MFPIGLVTHLGLSSPIVQDGRVIGFYDGIRRFHATKEGFQRLIIAGWIANRNYPVDMAGFAISVQLLKKYPNCYTCNSCPWLSRDWVVEMS